MCLLHYAHQILIWRRGVHVGVAQQGSKSQSVRVPVKLDPPGLEVIAQLSCWVTLWHLQLRTCWRLPAWCHRNWISPDSSHSHAIPPSLLMIHRTKSYGALKLRWTHGEHQKLATTTKTGIKRNQAALFLQLKFLLTNLKERIPGLSQPGLLRPFQQHIPLFLRQGPQWQHVPAADLTIES